MPSIAGIPIKQIDITFTIPVDQVLDGIGEAQDAIRGVLENISQGVPISFSVKQESQDGNGS